MAALKALIAQLIASAVLFSALRGGWLPATAPLLLASGQAVLAAALAAGLRSARWWLALHLVFAPMLVLASRWSIAPGWYLGAFLVLLVIYWTSFRTQVPLYLSNSTTVAAVAQGIPEDVPWRVLDLGSGTGSLLRPLARLRPHAIFHGIETAPGPYWLSRLLGRAHANLHFSRGSFWKPSWGDYDLVYAFLSPVPMAQLWEKATREMKPGAVLLSNTFPVPGAPPAFIKELADGRRTRLYGYFPGGKNPRHKRKRAAKNPLFASDSPGGKGDNDHPVAKSQIRKRDG